jgi:hypothetical protein
MAEFLDFIYSFVRVYVDNENLGYNENHVFNCIDYSDVKEYTE